MRARLRDDEYTVVQTGESTWEVLKPDGTVYFVERKQVRLHCSCLGFTYTGNCRHLPIVAAMAGAGEGSHKRPRPMGLMADLAEMAKKRLEGYGFMPTVAGSIRRGVKDLAGDIDIVLVVGDLSTVSPSGWQRLSGGANSATFLYRGVQVNVKATTLDSFGATLMHYTGSKNFNIRCRARAMAMGMKLNEFGLWAADGSCVASATEEDIFEALGMGFVAPEDREL